MKVRMRGSVIRVKVLRLSEGECVSEKVLWVRNEGRG